MLIGRSVHNISEFQVVFALLLLPNLHNWIAVYLALFALLSLPSHWTVVKCLALLLPCLMLMCYKSLTLPLPR